jgi:hypothetical protein
MLIRWRPMDRASRSASRGRPEPAPGAAVCPWRRRLTEGGFESCQPVNYSHARLVLLHYVGRGEERQDLRDVCRYLWTMLFTLEYIPYTHVHMSVIYLHK